MKNMDTTHYVYFSIFMLWNQTQVHLIPAQLFNNSFYEQLFNTTCNNFIFLIGPVCYRLEVLVWDTLPATDIINAGMETLEKKSTSSWV